MKQKLIPMYKNAVFMKKIIFYLFITLIVFSCSKDEDEVLPYPDEDTLHEF